MRRLALLLSALAFACDRASDEGERVVAVASAFTSSAAVPVELELDARVVVVGNDLAAANDLIIAQLMYSVGALNADRSVGRIPRATISNIVFQADGTATYHAVLPVAWGGGPVPATYALTLPFRTTSSDAAYFAAKYGATCADPEAGPPPLDPSVLFLFFRPRLPGCAIDASDGIELTAKVHAVAADPDRYPEYDRIWEDGVLDVIALFSRADAVEVTGTNDEGLHSYEDLQQRLRDYVTSHDAAATIADDTFTANLGNGRTLRVHTRLVDHDLSQEPPQFDPWYAERSPVADLILYNGHAGLGGNVRELMTKGRFSRGKYLLFAINACDSFAYVERILADRRAVVNPDDPTGTKYMDVLSNVMAGHFGYGAPTTMTLIDALAGEPETYGRILARLDPTQLATVTGEEDNTYEPFAAAPEDAGRPSDADAATAQPPALGPEPAPSSSGIAPAATTPAAAANATPPPPRSSSSCAFEPRATEKAPATVGYALALLLLARRRQLFRPGPKRIGMDGTAGG